VSTDADPGETHEPTGATAGEGNVPVVDARGAFGVQAGFFNTQINYYGERTWAGQPAKPPLEGSPYRGLSAFESDDAEWFFGRDEATAQVLRRLSGCARGPGLLVVSGVSGAGKSSLLRAGVLPRLRRDGLAGIPGSAAWPCLLFTPGPAPLDELAVQVARLAGIEAGAVAQMLAADPARFMLTARQAALTRQEDPAESPPGRLLLMVDQFEQLFALCSDEGHRRAFVTALHSAATVSQGAEQAAAALVMLGVRADFEARCGDYSELAAAAQDRYLLTAMTARQLRLAITGPAARAGSSVDADLTEVLLEEITARQPGHAQPATGAGVLPLLSHALDQAWRTRDGSVLTLADYERTGGIEAAVARSAQEAYDQLAPARQAIARYVFLRLTAAGPEGTDTAVPVATATLGDSGQEAGHGDVEAVLEAFTTRRLLTQAAGTVEITHEVLLTAWPLLRDTWLATTRADRIIRTGLTGAAAEWGRHGRDPAYLYSGSLLETATTAAARAEDDPVRHPPLSQDERAFLTASGRARRRRARIRQGLLAVMTALTVALATTTAVAIVQRNTANAERDLADTARNLLASNVLSAESEATGDADPILARLEAAAAWRLAPSTRTRYAMLKAAVLPATTILKTGTASSVYSVAFSPDGTTLAAATDDTGTAQLWNVATRTLIHTFQAGDGNQVTSVSFSQNGKALVVGTSSGTQIWDLATRSRLATLPLGDGNLVLSVAFTRDDTMMAIGTYVGYIELWDLSTGREAALLKLHATAESLAFSPDGKILASAGFSDGIQLWDVSTHRLIRTLPAGTSNGNAASSVAFAPGGATLATVTDGRTQLWDAATWRRVATLSAGSADQLNVAFTPDGKTLAVGTGNGTTQLWDVATRQLTATLGSRSGSVVRSVAFSPDGTILAAGIDDGDIEISDLAEEAIFTGPQATLSAPPVNPDLEYPGSSYINELAYSRADGMVAASTESGTVQLWNLATRQLAATLASSSLDIVDAVAFSPDGRMLATTDTFSVQLWNVAARRQVAALPVPSGNSVNEMAFSPDGAILAAGTQDGTELWDVATRKQIAMLPIGGSAIFESGDAVAFSPDGTILAAGTTNGIQLWDVATRKLMTTVWPSDDETTMSVAFSPDGKTLAAATIGDTVQVWDVPAGRQQEVVASINTDQQGTVMFSPDGTVLAIDTGSEIQLWDVATWQQISTVPANSGEDADESELSLQGLDLMAFSPDGSLIARGTGNGSIQLWGVPYLTNTLGFLCTVAREPFPPSEWSQDAPGVPYQKTCP
jgi:WD40 repeat protein